MVKTIGLLSRSQLSFVVCIHLELIAKRRLPAIHFRVERYHRPILEVLFEGCLFDKNLINGSIVYIINKTTTTNSSTCLCGTILWTNSGSNAMPDQTVTEIKQTLSTLSFFKNQFNILVLQCNTYQILN